MHTAEVVPVKIRISQVVWYRVPKRRAGHRSALTSLRHTVFHQYTVAQYRKTDKQSKYLVRGVHHLAE